MVWSPTISSEQFQELQELSPKVGEQEISGVVKEGVIGYIVPQTSLEWHVIKNAWQNTNIARKADSRMVMNS